MKRRDCWTNFAPRFGPVLLLLAVAPGCHKAPPTGKLISVEPAVSLVKPQRRDLHREVGQPGYVYAYEQTALYPKVTGFIEKWLVDIGDPIKKGELLAHIYVPELHAQYREKKAQVKLSEIRVHLAEEMVKVDEKNVRVAAADVQQARADIGKYQASVERWESEVKRLNGLSRIVDKQVLVESQRQLKLELASRSAAEAALLASQAREQSRQVTFEKSQVDVEAARAQVLVDKATEQRLAALVSYTLLTAPYDGIVIIRNANTGDYVGPRFGDESAPIGGTQSMAPTRGTPIYVVARTDIVRIYVDVPEMQAEYVTQGTKARVRIQALNDTEIAGAVTRTSWAVNVRSRTLRAEIDLPNKDARMRPGMYAYGLVDIERHQVQSIPRAAVVEIGNQNVCYLHENGKAVQTPVQTGINDGKYVEVFKKKIEDKWVEFTGDEEVILGDLAELRDGEKVKVAPATK